MNKYIVTIFLFIIAFVQVKSQENQVLEGLFPSPREALRYEIDRIEFSGNNSFKPQKLFPVISSNRSARSPQHYQLEFYEKQFEKNKATPKSLDSVLDKSLDNLIHEISFFNKQTADNDSVSLWHYYNINGFHYAQVYYIFAPDSQKKENVLTFFIEEKERYKLNAVEVIGLDSIPKHIYESLQRSINWKIGNPFNEEEIISNVNKIQKRLLNEGFYYSSYKKPKVTMDTINTLDSVTVYFNPGIRQRISNISFNEDRNNQKAIGKMMKQKQLAMKEGDWYQLKDIRRTESNLNSLGVFYSVSVDTNSRFAPITDSTLSMIVDLKYAKQLDYGGAFFLNQTTIDNFWNTGFEASISHSNLFGAAQNVSLFGNVALRNIGNIFNNTKTISSELQIEGRAGFKYEQPLLWTIDNSRVGFSSSFVFSASTINDFRLNTWTFPITFPTQFPRNTYFRTANLELSFERQEPINYEETVRNILGQATDVNDASFRALEALIYYADLDDFLKDDSKLLTSNLIGLSFIGESRNNPFNPTDGSYTFIGLDGWNMFLAHQSIAGLAKYFRFQFTRSDYFSSNNLAVHATKIRFGGIKLVDQNQDYVPTNRQFFAGGSNSVRGWQARKLHYSVIEPDSNLSQADYDFISNIVGSAALIEGSYEFRYQFQRPSDVSDLIAEQIDKLGFAAFVDFGNAFDWFAEDSTQTTFSDYFTKLAWAVGAGFRYDTPIGPIRVDFALPVYGPVFGKDERIWRRRNALSDYTIHLGIGHAF